MMKIAEMKSIIANKFKGENCSFTKNDIIIQQENGSHKIYIKDYEHVIFTMKMFIDEGEHVVYITNEDMLLFDECIIIENKNNYDVESALIELGYYIASRF